MADRPRTARLGGASIQGWVSIAIVAIGGVVGSWMSFQIGAATTLMKVQQLEKASDHHTAKIESLENSLSNAREKLAHLEALKHSHRRK